MKKRILVVDDDPSIVKVIKLFLNKSGYESEEESDGLAALSRLEAEAFDLAILDLMLPIVDGWAVCRQLRKRGDTIPIIMLTARGQVHERVEGLRMGADDYVVKPFDPHELIARIETVLRRTDSRSGGEEARDPSAEAGRLEVGNLRLDFDAFAVQVSGKPVSLPRKEFELLSFLAKRPGRAFSREDLIAQIWGWDYDGEDRVVDLYVQRLRRKLGGGKGWNIATVWGVGYRFEADA